MQRMFFLITMITAREIPIEQAASVHNAIPEFDLRPVEHFTERYTGKDHLIVGGYVDDHLAGYLIGYDRDGDGSFYCWMAGVTPQHRRKGVLSVMMDYEEEWARRRGYNKIKVKTRNKFREMLVYAITHGFNLTEVVQGERVEENWVHLLKEI